MFKAGPVGISGLISFVFLWNPVGLIAADPLVLKGHKDGVYSAEFTADGNMVMSCGLDQTVRIWDPFTGQILGTMSLDSGPTGFGFESALALARVSPNGKRALSVTAVAYDTGPTGYKGSRSSSGGGPDNHKYFYAKLWDTHQGKEIAKWNLDANPQFLAVSPFGAGFSPDSKKVATTFGSFLDREVRVNETEKGAELFRLGGHEQPVVDIAFSPDSKIIATVSLDETARLWDAEKGKLLHVLKGHTGAIHGLCFSPDGKKLVTLGNGTTHKFSVEPNSIGHSGSSNTQTMEPCLAKIWDVASGKETGQLLWKNAAKSSGLEIGPLKLGLSFGNEPKGYVRSAQFGKDPGKVLTGGPVGNASGGEERYPTIWDLNTGKPVMAFAGEPAISTFATAISPDSKKVASAGAEGSIRVFDAGTGEEINLLKGHTGAVRTLAFSPEGERLLSASSDGTVRVWPLEKPKK